MFHRQAPILLILAWTTMSLVGLSQAEIPQVMNFQSRITDSDGDAVPDGTYTMRFMIFNQASGGSDLWDSGDVGVDVKGSIASVLLGGGTQPPITLAFDEDYWLEVTFAGDVQTPRMQLGSAGYAFMASGLVPGTLIEGSVTSGTSSAIKAVNTASSGTRYGAYFESASTSGRGVYGWASDPTGTTYGGKFENVSTSGTGVYGKAYATTGTTYGGQFISVSTSGTGVYAEAPKYGVYGEATGTSGETYGVYGMSASNQGRGVHGEAPQIGVFGKATATTGNAYGGSFEVGPDHTGGYGAGVLGRNLGSSGSENYGGLFISWGLSGKGVKGWSAATTGTSYGVYGQSDSNQGRGVYGEAPVYGVYGKATATTGVNYGGYFETPSTSGSAVRGFATATSGVTYGVYGRTYSTADDTRGVYGRAYATGTTYGHTYGVYGKSDSSEGVGVYGISRAGVVGESDFVGGPAVHGYAGQTSGTTYAVTGLVESSTGWAGYFFGNTHVNGIFSKAAGSFLIDHPLDPENKLLRHNFVESPENLLIYRGITSLNEHGEAMVNLPDYYKALASESGASIQLTPRGKPFLAGYEWSADQTSFVVYGDPNRDVSWMVMAGRGDPVMQYFTQPVEEEKGPDNRYCDKGSLLYPAAYGFPESKGVPFKFKNTMGISRVIEAEMEVEAGAPEQ